MSVESSMTQEKTAANISKIQVGIVFGFLWKLIENMIEKKKPSKYEVAA